MTRPRWVLRARLIGAALGTLVLLGTMVLSAGAQGSPQTARGLITWTERVSKDSPGVQDHTTYQWGVLRIRMEQRGGTWQDAGSTYGLRGQQEWAVGEPAFPADPWGANLIDCTLTEHREDWGVAGRFADPPPSAILGAVALSLATDTGAGTAELYARTPGTDQVLVRYGFAGSACEGAPPERGLTANQGVESVCPYRRGSNGRDAAAGVIVIDCHDRYQEVHDIPDFDDPPETWTWEVYLRGRLVLR
jgi:hypothetical protein